MENTELLPLGTEQVREETEYSSFDLCLGESFVSPLVEQHRQWLKSIRHETPSPKIPFKVAVYIRFFNQTKYGDEEYLERNKEVFRATLAQYPLWKFVGFYIDNGSTAPYMEKSSAWTELLSDCDEGKVNLIITQKISNVSRKIHEVSICARMLAARNPPVGNARCSKASRWHLLHIRRSIHFGIVLSRRSSRALFSPDSRLEDPA